jgi:hypothetical protein
MGPDPRARGSRLNRQVVLPTPAGRRANGAPNSSRKRHFLHIRLPLNLVNRRVGTRAIILFVIVQFWTVIFRELN